jgi:3-phenylpropionate/trans-cinnamate dioxygenase ferredoxin reductase subunit
MTTFVIVGAGLAGAKAAEALREQGHDGELILFGDEQLPPYERPPLSKSYLMGDSPWEEAVVHPESWYADHGIDLRLGTRVSALHADEHVIEAGERVSYDKLLLATGSTPRRLPGDEGLLHLRRRGDSDAIKATFGDGRLVIVGGGWIGLEVAAAARQAGTEVTILEALKVPLQTAIGPELGQVFADLHIEHGVDLRTGVQVAEVHPDGVRLSDGTRIDARAVLIAIGARPNTDLAETAGLAVDNGVLVDAGLRTSDPDIYATGDIANAEHPFLGRRVRVEHWANALNQPATAAAAMLGRPASYAELPYFYTDQYDLGMENVGLAQDYAEVVFRGDTQAREFIAFWLDSDQRVLAGMNVNVWDVVEPIKALIRSRASVDPKWLADPDVPLDQVADISA